MYTTDTLSVVYIILYCIYNLYMTNAQMNSNSNILPYMPMMMFVFALWAAESLCASLL